MLTISRAISVGQAMDYYKQDFANSKENYYSESGEVKGQWCGTLAEEWNLKGEVSSEQYERLVAGQDPHTGEQLIRSVSARETVDEDGKKKITSTHRAGWDGTFSAPKSASLAALVGKDEGVIEAHIGSLNVALKEVEKHLQARGGGDNPNITTGKMIAVQFLHTSSRPDRETGYAAPQLHTHVVIINMTQTEDGKVRSVDPDTLYKSQKFASAIYRAELADRLQELGYEIRVDPRTGAPEIKGFTEEYLQDSSPRRKEVLTEKGKMKERLEREGKTVSDNARLQQAAARVNRRSKKFDHDLMRTRALEMDVRHGYQAQRVVAEARERMPLRLSQNEIEKRAQEAVTFAREKVMEKDAVADMHDVWIHALRRNLGFTNYAAVAAEIHRRQESGEFININLPKQQPQTTTERMLAMEKQNIQTMLDGKENCPAMVEAERVNEVVSATAKRQQRRLNAHQKSAIEQILSSRDQVIGLQGGAGTGKTTALSVLREAAEKEGYQVRGFAPSARAAQQLGESGIETETIQLFLRRRKPRATTSRLFVLDESSLASTKHVHKLFARLEPEDKVLLVGDVRQHQAVEAGSPFEQLQQHGMSTAALSEIVRQRDKDLKQDVENLAVRNTPEAVAALVSRGKVIEIADERERFEAIAQDYAKSPIGTLVISPANRERSELNSLIHRELQREGIVSSNDQQTTVYVERKDMTGAERTFANSYRPNEDIIRYNSASKKLKVKAGEYARVLDTDHEKNKITVRFFNGRELTYNPTRLSGVSVYYEAERAFTEGDRLQIRAPFRAKRIANGELGTITKIEPDRVRLAMDSGREVSVELRKFRHLDYGYAVTSYSAQGLTFNRVLINADTQESVRLLNDRMAYVAISRARYDARIYTDSTQNLSDAFNRELNKITALEAIQNHEREVKKHGDKFTKDHPDSQQQISADRNLDQSHTHIEPIQPAEDKSEIIMVKLERGPRPPIRIVRVKPRADKSEIIIRKLERGPRPPIRIVRVKPGERSGIYDELTRPLPPFETRRVLSQTPQVEPPRDQSQTPHVEPPRDQSQTPHVEPPRDQSQTPHVEPPRDQSQIQQGDIPAARTIPTDKVNTQDAQTPSRTADQRGAHTIPTEKANTHATPTERANTQAEPSKEIENLDLGDLLH
jgi:conjugative relaxase-like TrwC/TraI family protein